MDRVDGSNPNFRKGVIHVHDCEAQGPLIGKRLRPNTTNMIANEQHFVNACHNCLELERVD
jgi:hypothetical protein